MTEQPTEKRKYTKKPSFPSKKAFLKVCERLEEGEELDLEMIGDVFGPAFWMILVGTLLDANDAARAIQNSINRLKAGE
jgi:hypothetical protein